MTSSINEIQDIEIEELKQMDYIDMYSYFVEIGQDLPIPNDDCFIESLSGCQHNIDVAYWMSNGKMFFCGDSNSKIMKGIIAQLSLVLSHHSPEEIFNADIYIFDKIGLKSNVSTLRQVGIDRIVETFKELAKKEHGK